MTDIKPGDTVDPRTLPAGAVFAHTQGNQIGVSWKVLSGGRACHVATGYEVGSIANIPATIISLPQPVADEPVELGALEKDVCFDWDPAEDTARRMYPGPRRVTFSGKQLVRHAALDGSDGQTHRNLALRVRRVPAPTPAQQPSGRPPCDACGEELPDESARSFFVDQKESIICQACYYKRSNGEVVNDVRARRAKTSGSGNAEEHAESSPVVRKRPEPEDSKPRWHTEDPTRIAALEAKLEGQVASGGQDCEPARSLIERADDLRREETARSAAAFARRTVIHSHRMGLGAQEVEGHEPGIQTGPRLMRHELPESQRASYKSQSTDRKRAGR